MRRFLKPRQSKLTTEEPLSIFHGDDILTRGSDLQRSMIYHCFPLAKEDWRANVLDVWRYREVFNGDVLVSIATGPTCEPAASVMDWFDQYGRQEYHIVPNDPARGLNVSFRTQLQFVRDQPDGIVFKAHTKGITHVGDPIYGSVHWRQNMARGCLRDIDLVEQKFRDGYFSFASFKTTTLEGANVLGQIEGPVRDPWPGWHYPGAFYWFNPRRIPSRFFSLPEHHYENEAFPCHLGPTETGFSLTPDNFNFWNPI